jgi:benzodiazapine receptor
MVNSVKKYRSEILGVLLCLTLGLLSGYSVQVGDMTWYASLIKPSFNPPNWIFAPVWSALYIMMGIVLGRLWNEKSQMLLLVFATQFILNLLWSPLFFYYHRIDLALYDIGLLWLCLAIFMALAWRSHYRTILLLFTPYLLWVSFAGVLNLSIFRLNLLT